jgi:hypothetical protein
MPCPDEIFDVLVIERVCFDFLFRHRVHQRSFLIHCFCFSIAWTCYRSHSFYTLHSGQAFCVLCSRFFTLVQPLGCSYVETELGCFCLLMHILLQGVFGRWNAKAFPVLEAIGLLVESCTWLSVESWLFLAVSINLIKLINLDTIFHLPPRTS